MVAERYGANLEAGEIEVFCAEVLLELEDTNAAREALLRAVGFAGSESSGVYRAIADRAVDLLSRVGRSV